MWTLKKILLICLCLSIITGVFIAQNSKTKDQYHSATGHIEFLENIYENHPSRNVGKYRYLKIDGYPYPFELFIGKDAGDFKPKFEQIDELKKNDLITVYFYETEDTYKAQLNRFAQFIDQEGVSYFERGDSRRTLGYLMISLLILMVAGGYILYKKGKIPF